MRWMVLALVVTYYNLASFHRPSRFLFWINANRNRSMSTWTFVLNKIYVERNVGFSVDGSRSNFPYCFEYSALYDTFYDHFKYFAFHTYFLNCYYPSAPRCTWKIKFFETVFQTEHEKVIFRKFALFSSSVSSEYFVITITHERLDRFGSNFNTRHRGQANRTD